jgi:hypothetical protein
MTTNRIGRCPLCGQNGPLEKEHIIRRENSAEIQMVCHLCHVRHITPRQNELGVTPGLDPLLARPGGYGIYLTLFMEQHGLADLTDRMRIAENYWSQIYGESHNGNGKQTKRHKPRRRAAQTNFRSDETVMVRDVNAYVADMFTDQADDTRLTERQREDCKLYALYLSEAVNFPTEYMGWQRHNQRVITEAAQYLDAVLDLMSYGDVPAEEYRKLEDLFRREANSFLRWLDTNRWADKHEKVAVTS